MSCPSACWINRCLCNVLVGDLECVFIMIERSPPHLLLYLLLLNKEKQKKQTSKGSTGLNTEEPKTYLLLLLLFFCYLLLLLLYFFILFYVFTQTFCHFSIIKARAKFAKINIALIYLHHELLLLIMEV